MPNKFFVHLTALCVGVVGTFYAFQNCGPNVEHKNLRTAQTDAAVGAGDLAAEGPFSQFSLTVVTGPGVPEADSATEGYSLASNREAITGFTAELFCTNRSPVQITESPFLVSANAACVVALSSLSFTDGTFKRVGMANLKALLPGSKLIFEKEGGDQLIVEVAQQIIFFGDNGTASFRYFQVTRDDATISSTIKDVNAIGSRAPSYRLAGADLGTSPAGITMRLKYNCKGQFDAKGKSDFSCDGLAKADSLFMLESFVEWIDFAALERNNRGAVDGETGLLAQLARLSRPLAEYNPVVTRNGFNLTVLLPDVATDRFNGLPGAVGVGISNQDGAVAFTNTELVIR
jgi:hypothetical protein